MPVRAYYKQLHLAAGGVLDESFSHGRADLMAKAHGFIDDLEKWTSVLGPRKEAIALNAAAREYQFALFALSLGSYRSAFSALRLFLELAFASIRWSVNEQEIREWLRGERDLIWSALVESDSGILSKKVLQLYSEVFSDESPPYRSFAGAVYRECSQFIHGNAITNNSLPSNLQFDLPTFTLWHDKASATRLVVTFALASRYLADLSIDEKSRLEHCLLDALGHSPSVRQLLGAPVEVANG